MSGIAGDNIIAVSAPTTLPSRADIVRPPPVSIYSCLSMFIVHADYCSDAAGQGLRDASAYD